MDAVEEFFRKKHEVEVNKNLLVLLQDYKSDSSTVHIFVEADDDFQFYRHFIARIFIGFKVYPYRQKGKARVLEAYQAVDWTRFSKWRVMFFYDKDYDDLVEKTQPLADNIFRTVHYSIENYFVHESVIKIVVLEILQSENREFLQKVLELFRKAHHTFSDRMRLITSWILVYRKLEEHLVLDNFPLNKIFRVVSKDFEIIKFKQPRILNLIRKDPGIDGQLKSILTDIKLKLLMETDTEADPGKFNYKSALAFSRKVGVIGDTRSYIRGKFHLWFFLEFCQKTLKKLISDHNAVITEYNQKPENSIKVPKINPLFELTAENVFHILPPKLEVPEDLALFLNHNYSQRNGNN
ncbi:MAG: DUF4435 domain-containing protein [Chitinophagaceae bacterium]|nr:MAG: DUF4435 domain-containing protein [Chitinophagaceae bacterium]